MGHHPSSWHKPTSTIGKAWVNFWRKVYNPMGFQKGYNFILWFITIGALFGFTLARLQYLHFPILLKKANPFDAPEYADRHSVKGVGIQIHLIGIFVSSLLVILQFIPVIRHKVILFHRMNGYLVLVLYILQMVGAYMCIHSTGGRHPSTRTALALVGFVCTIAVLLAYYYIKTLRIDLHREWMIRTWVWAGTVITARVINLAVFSAMNRWPDYPNGPWYSIQLCKEIYAQYAVVGIPAAENPTSLLYPECTSPDSLLPQLVQGSLLMGPENASAWINIGLTMSQWLANIIHAVCLEIYFRVTIAEGNRLKKLSMQKRLERGWKVDPEYLEELTPANVARSDRSASDVEGKSDGELEPKH